ncbi:metalloprotease-like protein, partial [Methylobacterium sp. IIF4SW-B5]|nr:metalloprotease-like protein [Methylobacterium ajmalii]
MTGQTTMRRMVAVLMGVGTLALAGCGGSTDRAAPPPVV